MNKNAGTDGLSRIFFDRNAPPRYNPRPMSGQQQRLPQQVDPFRLATKEEHLQGLIPLKQMKRLTSALESEEGEVSIDVIFSIDVNRVVLLAGQIKTEVKLICQRCMEEMTLPIELDFQLAFVRSEAEMDRLPDEYEANLVEQTPVMLSDIIEDELLLALPAIPKHLNDNCPTAEWKNHQATDEENTGDIKQENPFDVLANLKTDKQDEA